MSAVPAQLSGIEPKRGPVLVLVEYCVLPAHASAFLAAMQSMRIIRRRDGAVRWGLFEDLTRPHRYVETFVVASLGEHLRQHERATAGDRLVEEHLQHLAERPPEVSHLIASEL